MPIASTLEASRTQEQPSRRSRRHLNKPTASVPEQAPIRRTIYVRGNLPKKDLSDWDKLLYEFHADDTLQDTVDTMLGSAQHFLKWRTSPQGQGYSAAKPIPARTRF
jgi:hypothetical protein